MDALSMLLENVHLYDTKFYCLKGHGDWSYTLTRKDTILFYLVIDGGFCMEVLGETRQAHTGDVIMIPHATHHVAYALGHHGNQAEPLENLFGKKAGDEVRIYGNNGDCANADIVLIECRYDKEVTRPLLTALPGTLPEHNRVTKNVDKLSEQTLLDLVVAMLGMESCEDRMGKATMINRLASIIMIDCLRVYIEDLPEATDSWLMAIKDPYLAKALAVMHNSPDKNWTIHKLAEVAGMSRSSFAERFKQIVGVPPLTYLIDYRLRLAARYLRLQQNSISRISELVGYASDSTFSQAFKRVYGVSPRAYRQRFKHEDANQT